MKYVGIALVCVCVCVREREYTYTRVYHFFIFAITLKHAVRMHVFKCERYSNEKEREIASDRERMCG